MKILITPYIYILLFLFICHHGNSQKLDLILKFPTKEKEAKNISVSYRQNHFELDSLIHEAHLVVKKLERQGYLNAKLDSIRNDSIQYTSYYDLGKNYERIKISYGNISAATLSEKEIKDLGLETKHGSIEIKFEQLEFVLQQIVELLESKGNSFASVNLEKIRLVDSIATAQLNVSVNRYRTIDKIVIKGYDHFPRHFIKHELNLKTGSVFNRQKLDRASIAIDQLTFADEIKAPEVLFTEDSTIVYLYIKKKRANKFDGILGFASKEQESGIEFNGYLDLVLNNIFNGGESIAVFWKNNGNDRQRFYLEAETPYLFGLPVVPKLNFQLYRQDSTFSNTTVQVDLKYRFQNIGDLGLFGSFENSTDLLKVSSSTTEAYQNQFYGLSYELQKPIRDEIFQTKYRIDLKGMIGNRTSEGIKTNQSKFVMNINYLIPFNQKHFVFLQNFSGILFSDDYLDNELFRIGGINNLRGVNEEQIITPSYSVFNLEYRFKPNLQSYFYTITDLGLIDNHIEEAVENVLSLGLGYSFRTKAGILNLSYAIGKFSNEPFAFDNSKIHIKIISIF